MQLNLYQERVLVFSHPVDFRKSIPGLLQIIEADYQLSSREGIYIFYNRKRDKIKCLLWHKNGYILMLKHLAAGKFPFTVENQQQVNISVAELGWLLAGLEWQQMRSWGELEYDKFS